MLKEKLSHQRGCTGASNIGVSEYESRSDQLYPDWFTHATLEEKRNQVSHPIPLLSFYELCLLQMNHSARFLCSLLFEVMEGPFIINVKVFSEVAVVALVPLVIRIVLC
jgi:hypothetical protein